MPTEPSSRFRPEANYRLFYISRQLSCILLILQPATFCAFNHVFYIQTTHKSDLNTNFNLSVVFHIFLIDFMLAFSVFVILFYYSVDTVMIKMEFLFNPKLKGFWHAYMKLPIFRRWLLNWYIYFSQSRNFRKSVFESIPIRLVGSQQTCLE